MRSEAPTESSPLPVKERLFKSRSLWRPKMPLRILLADDHLIVRQGLKSLLEQEQCTVVAEAGDGREAIQLAQKLHPDIAVLDLAMPQLNGLDAAREILKVSPEQRKILLTIETEEPYVVEALRAGVRGYLLKTQAASDLMQAVREGSRGEIYLSPGISGAIVDAYLAKTDFPPDPLTPREREVLQLVAEGKTTKESASILGAILKPA